MAASDQEILDAAKDSLKRILDADTAQWGEAGHQQTLLRIEALQNTIEIYEKRVAAASRRTCMPIKSIAD